MDLFYFFFHFGLNHVKENGQITFISTNYYPTALGARKLRKELKKAANIRTLLNFNELKIFESATGQHNMITILSKGYDDNVVAENCVTKRTGIASTAIIQNIIEGTDEETDYYEVAQKELYEGEECYIRLTGNSEKSDNPVQGVLSKVKKQGVLLGSICVVNTGIMGGCDFINKNNIHYSDKLEIELKDIRLGDGVFVLDEKNERDASVIKNTIMSNYLKRFFKNSDIGKYYTNDNTTKLIIFSSPNNGSQSNKYIKDHLDKFRSILERIRSINNEKISYYPFLRRGTAHQEIFESPKIVAPQRSPNNTFGYNEIPWYGSADIYFITENDKSISLKYILALLNSKVYYVWLYYRGKRKGETLELYQKPLSEIPIKKISTEGQRPFIEIVDKILEITKTEDYLQNHTKQARVKEFEKQIDQMVYKLYSLTEEEIKTVEAKTSAKDATKPILECTPSSELTEQHTISQ